MPKLPSFATLNRAFGVGLILTGALHGPGYLGIRPLRPTPAPVLEAVPWT